MNASADQCFFMSAYSGRRRKHLETEKAQVDHVDLGFSPVRRQGLEPRTR
ncbi:hypothetical protein ABZV14_34540 [Streptosporangium canum]